MSIDVWFNYRKIFPNRYHNVHHRKQVLHFGHFFTNWAIHNFIFRTYIVHLHRYNVTHTYTLIAWDSADWKRSYGMSLMVYHIFCVIFFKFKSYVVMRNVALGIKIKPQCMRNEKSLKSSQDNILGDWNFHRTYKIIIRG